MKDKSVKQVIKLIKNIKYIMHVNYQIYIKKIHIYTMNM